MDKSKIYYVKMLEKSQNLHFQTFLSILCNFRSVSRWFAGFYYRVRWQKIYLLSTVFRKKLWCLFYEKASEHSKSQWKQLLPLIGDILMKLVFNFWISVGFSYIRKSKKRTSPIYCTTKRPLSSELFSAPDFSTTNIKLRLKNSQCTMKTQRSSKKKGLIHLSPYLKETLSQ